MSQFPHRRLAHIDLTMRIELSGTCEIRTERFALTLSPAVHNQYTLAPTIFILIQQSIICTGNVHPTLLIGSAFSFMQLQESPLRFLVSAAYCWGWLCLSREAILDEIPLEAD